MKIKSLVITAVLVTAVLCFGPSVNAQTADVQAMIAQLQAQIQSLMQQIAQLQAQQGQGQAWCHTFTANIGVGQKTGNPEIAALKTALQLEGVFGNSSVSSDGGYDETLASAVTGFQEKYASEVLASYGLKHGTGYVGKSTRAKLNALYGCGTNPRPQCATDNDCPLLNCGPSTTSAATNCVGTTQFKCIDGKCVAQTQPSGIILFYGQGCPHCTNVDNYIVSNNITQKVDFKKLEVWSNTDNANLMKQKATACGLDSSSVGVPFLWDGSNCYVGDTAIINFFSKYVSTRSLCTDSDGGENVYISGSSQAGNYGQGDYCDFSNNANGSLFEAVCQDGKPTAIPLSCPSDAPYCRNGKCVSTNSLVCTDSDGGIYEHIKGTIKESRIAEGPEHTDYCEDLNTYQPFNYDPSQNSCSGGSNCGLREYYCASPYQTTTYRDISCPNGCENGACKPAPTTLKCLGCPDVDGNGGVNLGDSLIITSKIGKCVGDDGYDTKYDINKNGCIGLDDAQCARNAIGTITTCAQSNPTVTVLSPNGGETLVIGGSNVISWTGQGLSTSINNYHGSNNIDIELTKGGGLYQGLNDYCSVISINSYGGSANCVIQSNVLTGSDYKIATIDNTAKVSDASDNYFSIVAQ